VLALFHAVENGPEAAEPHRVFEVSHVPAPPSVLPLADQYRLDASAVPVMKLRMASAAIAHAVLFLILLFIFILISPLFKVEGNTLEETARLLGQAFY
jgi:hypothetical protein